MRMPFCRDYLIYAFISQIISIYFAGSNIFIIVISSTVREFHDQYYHLHLR